MSVTFLLTVAGAGLLVAVIVLILCRKERKNGNQDELKKQIWANIEQKILPDMVKNCGNGQVSALAGNSGTDYCTKGFDFDPEELKQLSFDLSYVTVSGKES
ncbi:MAG: hypothetical protein LUD84_10560 [Clostridiales bacterium]|nr:hypothetical protein [Clostridiales bacterium]